MWQRRRGTQSSVPPMLLLQLALIFTVPYISTLTSVLGLVSVEKLLHTGLGSELIAHPRREHCRYSEDLCAQGRYCGASQGVNLPHCGTSSPTHAAGVREVCVPPPGPARLHAPSAHIHLWHFSTKKSPDIFANLHHPIPVLLRLIDILILASCLRGKKVVLFPVTEGKLRREGS